MVNYLGQSSLSTPGISISFDLKDKNSFKKEIFQKFTSEPSVTVKLFITFSFVRSLG